MEKLNFETESDCIEYMEGLVGRPIEEIIKHHDNQYVFKINSYWYKLEISSVSRDSVRLFLESGENIDALEKRCVKFFNDNILKERLYRILKTLEKVYSGVLLFDKPELIKLTECYIDLINEYNIIEKFSSKLFTIKNDKKIICFKIVEEFNYKHYQEILIVSEIIGDNELKKEKIRNPHVIKGLFGFLNYLYYSSKIEEIDEVKKLILKYLKS